MSNRLLSNTKSKVIVPNWSKPTNIKAVFTSRQGGVSSSPWDSFNLGLNTQDDEQSLKTNRDMLAKDLPNNLKIQWLKQVHAAQVYAAKFDSSENLPTADICFTTEQSIACAVLTADCLPILICDKLGTEVAAVHAGWRGLVCGVLQNAIEQFTSPVEELSIWIGPAICQNHFEVGQEVIEAMLEAQLFSQSELPYVSLPSERETSKSYLNLVEIAKRKLQQLGVIHISGGQFCSYCDVKNFYSYRRDGETGRMASLIWIEN